MTNIEIDELVMRINQLAAVFGGRLEIDAEKLTAFRAAQWRKNMTKKTEILCNLCGGDARNGKGVLWGGE